MRRGTNLHYRSPSAEAFRSWGNLIIYDKRFVRAIFIPASCEGGLSPIYRFAGGDSMYRTENMQAKQLLEQFAAESKQFAEITQQYHLYR